MPSATAHRVAVEITADAIALVEMIEALPSEARSDPAVKAAARSANDALAAVHAEAHLCRTSLEGALSLWAGQEWQGETTTAKPTRFGYDAPGTPPA